jgi:hypothetical protein
MNNVTWQRLFGFRHAFDDPVTVVLTLAVVALLLLAPLLISSRHERPRALPTRERNFGIAIAPGSGWCC